MFLGRDPNPEKGVKGQRGKLKVYDLNGAIPFSGHFTADKDAENNKHRLRVYRKFMGVQDFEGRKVLDIGKPNYISRELKIAYNTVGDLNKGVRPRPDDTDFDIITSFEVFAHVMNPLLLTQECYRLLRPGGTMYLGTPLLWLIPWFHGRGNFTEYKKDRVQIIHEYVGFKPVRYEWHNPWHWWFIFNGIRPPLRYLHNRFQLWELRKPS